MQTTVKPRNFLAELGNLLILGEIERQRRAAQATPESPSDSPTAKNLAVTPPTPPRRHRSRTKARPTRLAQKLEARDGD